MKNHICLCQDTNGIPHNSPMTVEEYKQDGMCSNCAEQVWKELSSKSNYKWYHQSKRNEVVMKPIVNYEKSPYDKLILGQSAFVFALNHPRLGKRFVRTSTVEKITQNGFITQNTTYIGVDANKLQQTTTPAKVMADFDKNWNAEVKP